MAYRDFVDPTGIAWKVWDTYPPSAANVRPLYAEGWLTFQSPTERRRLHPVPRGWEGATDDELRGWLKAAHPVRAGEAERQPHPAEAEPASVHGPAARAAEPSPGDTWQRTRAVVEQARRVIRLVNSAIHRGDREE